MNKIRVIAAVLLPVLALAVWITALELSKRSAQDVVIAARGYDPLDIFRGRYIRFSPDWDRTDCSQFANNFCPENDFSISYDFYLDESIANVLDKELRRFGREGAEIEAVDMIFAYRKGSQPLLMNMLINDVPYMEWYENNHVASQ